jgi:hypothetical protein
LAKGSPPAWSRRDCRFDHLVVAALEQGYGKELRYTGIESYERADEIRRGIYRCTKHRGVTGDAGPSRLVDAGTDAEQMGIRKTGKTYELRYRVWDKRQARKRHIERHGTDRASWPYDPRRRATAEERESWANRNERGEPVIY